MPTLHCDCGARYRFPDTAAGKRAKCKECGTILTLVGDDDLAPIPIADDAFADEAASATERAEDLPSVADDDPMSAAYLPTSVTAGRLGPVVIEEAEKARGYGQDLVAAFLFPKSVHNSVTFLVLWVVFFILTLILGGGAMGIGIFALVRFVCYLAFLGWWASYRFNVVAAGAAGEDDLPKLVVSNEGVVGLLAMFLKWIGSWVLVLAPAAAFAALACALDWMDPVVLADSVDDGLSGILFSDSGRGSGVFAGLVVAGMFLWPMVILCVAIGGFDCLARPDLILSTITRTFPAYVLTVSLVFGIESMNYVLTGAVEARMSAGEGASLESQFGSSIPVSILVVGITIYTEIVAMKLIGLYYHHFKERFAWDWG